MAEYRLYFLDPDGRRLGAFDFASSDDDRAQQAAVLFGGGRGAELWCGAREVGRWRRDTSCHGRSA
jgi:hypothetical protein